MTMKSLISIVLVTFFLSCSGPILATEQAPPPSSSRQEPVVLNQASWTDEERQQWYHLSPGTQLLPYHWFLALEEKPFKNNFHRFGVLTNSAHPNNLPIGFGETQGPDVRARQLGITCAFCHTSEFSYHGKTFRIDGGPSLQYNARFVQALIEALVELRDPSKFRAFTARLVAQNSSPQPVTRGPQLAEQLRLFTAELVNRAGRDSSPALWGPGRFDALGRGGNLVFMPLSPDNIRPANSSVSIPALWGAWRYDWVQWSGSIQHPLGRNIAQVIGVNATLFCDANNPLVHFVDPNDPFRSSVDIPRVRILESLAKKLIPPRWPEEFPPIDAARAARGRDLYHGVKDKNIPNLCAHCHVAPSLEKELSTGQRLHVRMIPQKEVGTDRLYLDNFAGRKVDTGSLGKGILSIDKASEHVTTEIMVRGGVIQDPEYKDVVNEWRAHDEYIARPHVAIWATAPYLHNGSVPNLYELLSPAKERHDCFYLSPNMEFDPTMVGFTILDCTGNSTSRDPLAGFEFKTGLPGNRNIGHEFANTPRCASDDKEPGVLGCEISPENRLSLIEYLKTCDLEDIDWKRVKPCLDLGPAFADSNR